MRVNQPALECARAAHHLGRLKLWDSSLKRPAPLVLLSCLALEGEPSRDYLAELFWQREGKALTRRQLLNNFSKAVSDLRKHAPSSVQQTKCLVTSRN